MGAKEELRELEELEALEAKASGGTPGALERGGASILAGFGKAATGMVNLPNTLATLGIKGLAAMGNETARKAQSPEAQEVLRAGPMGMLKPVNKAAEFYGDLSQKGAQNPDIRAALEGAGGGLLGGPNAVIPGAVGNLAAEKTEKQFGPLAGAGAGLLAGGVAGYLTSPEKLSFAERQIRSALRGTSTGEFAQARANRALVEGAGARTATAADLFPGNVPLKSLQNEVAAAKGGELLQGRLAGREADLEALTQAVAQRAGPRADVSQVANRTAEAAGDVITSTKRLATEGLTNRLAGQNLSEPEVNFIVQSLRTIGRNAPRDDVRDAYEEVARAMLSRGTTPIRSVQELSFALKSLKENAPGPSASTGRVISSVDRARAIDDAETLLGQFSRPFAEGMDDFRQFQRQAVDPLREGAIGAVADKTSLVRPTPGSRLDALVTDQTPRNIQQNMGLLRDQGADPAQIAAAIVQRKLQKGGTDPARALYGSEGSPAEQQLAALLQSGGRNPQEVLAPARAATLLQGSQNLPGRQNDLIQAAGSFLAQPYAALKNAFNQSAREKNYSAMAEILRDPRNLERLQQIAMTDPATRKALTMYGAITPALVGTGE